VFSSAKELATTYMTHQGNMYIYLHRRNSLKNAAASVDAAAAAVVVVVVGVVVVAVAEVAVVVVVVVGVELIRTEKLTYVSRMRDTC
jgi:hypothetical protein